MKQPFLLDDGPTALAPFFSQKMFHIITGSLVIVCSVLLFTWPRQDPAVFVAATRTPSVFLITAATILIVAAYVNMVSGRGEVIENTRIAMQLHQGVVTWEERRGFLSYGLPVAVVQSMLFLALLTPPLVMAATLIRISWPVFFDTWGVIVSTGLICRLFAMACFLLWGRWHFIGWLATRLFYLGFIFGSAFLVPALNPLRLVHEALAPVPMASPWLENSSSFYLVVALNVIVFLIVLNKVLWHYRRYSRSRSKLPEGQARGQAREQAP